jgi:glutathione synthase/RimK-type ligase-like ATP-grasp enzyme
VDKSKPYYYIEDKWMFFVKCRKNKIPSPETILLSKNKEIIKKELKNFNHWPVILKRVIGTMGEYVNKAENVEDAIKIIDKFWNKGNEKLSIIAQEFIKSPSYRVTVIGSKIVQTAVKKNKDWKSTGNYTKTFEKFPIDKELKKLVDKVIKMSGIKICGIDFMKKDDRWLVLEVNSEPGLDFFEKERRKLISETIDYLVSEIKKT